jgi:hypothetical protein
MVSRKRNNYQVRRNGRSLIAANKIKPDLWRLSHAEIKNSLQAQGYNVKEIRKVRYLKHQICISYRDEQDGVCSGFFSYRIFIKWQTEVCQIIYSCRTLTELLRLNNILQYEFYSYPYPTEMQDFINDVFEIYTFNLKTKEIHSWREAHPEAEDTQEIPGYEIQEWVKETFAQIFSQQLKTVSMY